MKQDCQLSIAHEALSPDLEAENVDMLSQALRDRYRYPDKFFDFRFKGSLSTTPGYFRFGSNAICYGRSSSAVPAPRPGTSFQDVIRAVSIDNKKLSLPFNLTEIIDNLRLERYANRGTAKNLRRLLRKLYYRVRPLTTLTFRKQVQRFHARNWRKRIFPQWPVDTTVENVLERVLLLSMNAAGVEELPFVWFWPDGAASCLVMTHDVETAAGRDACANLMNVDDSYEIKGAFGIVPERRYEVSPDFLMSMQSRGFEVTIQDLNHDGRLFDDQKEFLRRAEIINRYGAKYGARGFRAAVLYREPEWYHALEFAFDMSIPNSAPLDPQHGGCCTVFPFFIGEILELPLTTTQDYTLFHVLNERSLDLWKTQIELILKKNGMLSFIVHPDYVMAPDTLPVYKALLSYLRELRKKESIWCALPHEINTWWRARSKMSVVKNGSTWRIVGEGAERAVLAFAKNVGGKVVYEFSPAARPQ